MVSSAAVLVCLVLAALAVLQASLALGAPLGRFAWGGQHRVLPPSLRIGSGVSIVIYTVLAGIVLARADLVSTGLPDTVVRTATWAVVGYFLLGAGMNLMSRSTSERALMSPLCAVLCALCAVVAAT